MTIEENLNAIRVGVEATVKLLTELLEANRTTTCGPGTDVKIDTGKAAKAAKATKPEAAKEEVKTETVVAETENASDAIMSEKVKNTIKDIVKINRNEAIELLKKYGAANFTALKREDYTRFLFEADKKLKELTAEGELV